MSHLTEEQFEDILQGRTGVPAHVDACPACQARLAEKRSLAGTVRKVFSAMHASPDLAERITTQVAAGRAIAVSKSRSRIVPIHGHRRLWSGLAIAAAVIMVVILRSSNLNTLSPTQAAQMALVGIHRINLDSLESLMAGSDLPSSCECLRSKSHNAMPCCQRGLCVCGCQMREFQGRLVECCVIQKPNAPAISVVVVPELPAALGMTPAGSTTVAGQTIWQVACGSCNMASVRLDDGSCCVIGEVPHEDLVAVLNAFEK